MIEREGNREGRGHTTFGVGAAQIARARAIIVATARYYGLPTRDLVEYDRRMETTHPRAVAMWLLTECFGLTATLTGHLMERDHSTVLHNRDKTRARLRSDPAMRAVVAEIRDDLAGQGIALGFPEGYGIRPVIVHTRSVPDTRTREGREAAYWQARMREDGRQWRPVEAYQ